MVGVTGIGSLPGIDLPAALRFVLAEFGGAEGGLPHLPELPARGPWAAMIGRGCAVLVDLPTSLDAGVWRLSDTVGSDGRRARTTLRDDVDMLQEQASDWVGPFKVQVTGPWTLAASVFRPLGGRVLADRSARRDLAQSLAQGTADLLADVRRRLPQAEVVLQVDEPALPSVLAGQVPTEGGFFRHRSIDRAEAADALRPLSDLTERSVLHCCAARFDLALAVQSGFAAVSIDQDHLDDLDAIAALVDGGTGLYLGCLPTANERTWTPDELADRVLRTLRPLELGQALATRLTLTPACGLAGWSPAGTSAAYRALVRTAEIVADQLHR